MAAKTLADVGVGDHLAQYAGGYNAPVRKLVVVSTQKNHIIARWINTNAESKFRRSDGYAVHRDAWCADGPVQVWDRRAEAAYQHQRALMAVRNIDWNGVATKTLLAVLKLVQKKKA